MGTLLLRLSGPMQSWGTQSRFDERDTDVEPSKSGVLGLVCAALGRDRSQPIDDLASLRMGVRVDRPGVVQTDFHTAQNVIAADQSKVHETAVTRRHFLADAVFLVGLEGVDTDVLRTIAVALRNPRWPLSLGRKSFAPSEPLFLGPPYDGQPGLVGAGLEEALATYPPLTRTEPSEYRYVLERDRPAGSVRMDQPLGPFRDRAFGARYVLSVTRPAGEVPTCT